MKKADLRKTLLLRRLQLTSSFVESASEQIQHNLLSSDVWKNAEQVVLYSPIKNEVQTTLLFEDIWKTGRKLLLPRCDEQEGAMSLVACEGHDDLGEGKFGILEPLSHCLKIDYESSDFAPSLIVVPGVGFDVHGRRIGFGGGYYDRMLTRPAFNHATFVGFAYSFQVAPVFMSDPWDQNMHALCTEEGLQWL